MADRYQVQIEEFVAGVDWDSDGDVRQVALSAAGELLRSQPRMHLLRLLQLVFESPDERPLIRQGAYFALARAAGRSWDELPSASRRMDLEKDVDRAVLSWVDSQINSHD
jgi:hypothetical protein